MRVAVGVSPRFDGQISLRRGATLDEGRRLDVSGPVEASLRDAILLRPLDPRAEAHGYRHQVAPRLQETEMPRVQMPCIPKLSVDLTGGPERGCVEDQPQHSAGLRAAAGRRRHSRAPTDNFRMHRRIRPQLRRQGS